MSLLDVLRGVMLDPAEQAAYNADPHAYLEQYGYDDVDPADLSEAFGLVADTLPPEQAQAAWSAAAEPDDSTFGTVTQDFDGDAGIVAPASDLGGSAPGTPGGSDLADGGLTDSDLADGGLTDSDLADSDLAHGGLTDSDLADGDLTDDLAGTADPADDLDADGGVGPALSFGEGDDGAAGIDDPTFGESAAADAEVTGPDDDSTGIGDDLDAADDAGAVDDFDDDFDSGGFDVDLSDGLGEADDGLGVGDDGGDGLGDDDGLDALDDPGPDDLDIGSF